LVQALDRRLQLARSASAARGANSSARLPRCTSAPRAARIRRWRALT